MLRGWSYIPPNTAIPFLRWRKVCFALSTLMIVGSLLLIFFKGFNLGIDFKGGILLDVKTSGPADLAEIRRTLGGLGLGDVSLQEFGAPDTILIRLPMQPGGEAAQHAAVQRVREALGDNIDYRRVELVGPQVSNELFINGMWALAASVLGIVVYIWFRFEWPFAIGAIIAEAHDVITTLGLFALLGLEFNMTIVAAVLTIAGYSINDTVVVYDRVRENLRKYKTMPLEELLNLSLNQTLSRTVNTSLATALAVLALHFLGGEVIHGFSTAMLWGLCIGVYSTVAAAVPLLMYFPLRRLGVAKPEADAAAESSAPA